ncbi:calcium-binding protein [Pararhizobium arenae]|uniref:calcium-binding protein n=1 Tax=Pararhizobium arenae TaxID=1856850 RepID=UPI00094ACDE9|nr:calcium-binding protein [Pararhizobium arenae]
MGVTVNGNDSANEIIQGNRPQIIINARGGNDVIVLNLVGNLGGDNFVDAGSGDDVVDNRVEGGNEIRLGANNDTYVGQGFAFTTEGFDVVFGGTGNDTMAVTTFNSRYFGEGDNDTFISEGWQNVFDGGSGTDTLSYELRDESNTLGGTGVEVDLAQGFAITGNNRFEDFVSIENATGTNVRDELFGSSVANVLKGRDGNDQLVGRAGNDTLDGGAGADEMVGGAGNDTYLVQNAGDIVDELNDGGSGIDTVKSSISFSLAQSSRVGGVVEKLTLVGTGAINATGNSSANVLTGNSAGNTLDGATGADTMIGGAGNDTYVVQDTGDIVNETASGGAGTDTVKSSISFSLAASSKVIGTFEKLVLTGTSAINGTGNGSANAMTGNNAINTLNGAAGDDLINGGLGNDVLIGGSGKDKFIFKTTLGASTNVDRITDFNVADDTIQIENAVFTAIGAAGPLSASKFVKNTTGLAGDNDDRIIYETDTGKLFYDSNGKASGGSVHFATIGSNLSVTASDFLIV